MSISLGDRFNSAVGIEMIDDISKTEHKFDSIASVGKFGMYQESFLINRVSIFLKKLEFRENVTARDKENCW